jgi:hypothetical protein
MGTESRGGWPLTGCVGLGKEGVIDAPRVSDLGQLQRLMAMPLTRLGRGGRTG